MVFDHSTTPGQGVFAYALSVKLSVFSRTRFQFCLTICWCSPRSDDARAAPRRMRGPLHTVTELLP